MLNVEKKENKNKKILSGRVISDKMDKTVVMAVEKTFKHPKLHKILRKTKNYKVHDEQGVAKVGDFIEAIEGRPKSKTKYMYFLRVIHVAAHD